MPITGPIPLPKSGMSILSSGLDSMFKDLLEKKKLKQLEDHFQEQLKLSKAAAARAAQAAADNHRIALNKLDPTYEARQYEALENYFKSKHPIADTQDVRNMPTQETGQGMGMFTPEGLQDAQQPKMQTSEVAPSSLGIDLDLMRQHPMLRGWYKHHFGVDPLAQTPEDKLAFETQKEYAKATAKEWVKRQSELGDAFNDTQSGLSQIGRIKQLMENYQKESEDIGYSPHYGIGAEYRTEPNVLKRIFGRIEQRVSHPLETLAHPLDMFETFGGGKGTEVHERYLSQLRGELNNLVNTQAKNLNSKFTQREYEILLANKPSISDSETVFRGKLQAIHDALQAAAVKMKMQQSVLQKGAKPGLEPYISESKVSSENVGRLTTGKYNKIGENNFKTPKYEYIKRNGKFYRRKIGDKNGR